LLDWTARHLAERNSEFPRLDAEVLLAHALECRRIDLYTRYEELAPDVGRSRFRDLVRRRLEGCPVAYLVGRKEFFSLQFEVGPAVLIPRPESEFVVLECLRLAKPMAEPRILDIGTGSGNIAVAVAYQHHGARVVATDISGDALALAEKNASRHGVSDRIEFKTSDLFDGLDTGDRFDFILSNPPYIAREDLDKLPVGVRQYEPRAALDGGPGGYVVFDKLVTGARSFLANGGHLIVEIGSPQEVETRARISAAGYELGDTIRDGSRHPRVLSARWARNRSE
jgi:release factor glutamine methyltransferase